LKIFFELTSIFKSGKSKKFFKKHAHCGGKAPRKWRGLDILRGLKILLCEFKPRFGGKKV